MKKLEKKPLLSKNIAYSEVRRKSSSTGSSSGNDNWSDDSSSSYYSDSDSYVPEWDSFVNEEGELVYIITKGKNEPNQSDSTAHLLKVGDTAIERGGFTRQSVRRSSKGKWLKALRRRNSARSTTKNNSTNSSSNNQLKKQMLLVENQNKVTFSENQEGELKEITLEVDFSNRAHLGRKQNQFESLFGISTNTFGDGKRLMVSGILSEFQASNQKQIKIGDWLKEIDNNPVNADNIEQILNNYSEEKVQVRLLLQRIAGTEVKDEPSLNNSHNLKSDLIKHLTNEVNEHETVLAQILRDLPVAVIYLATEGLTENGPENEGVLYCYPRPEKHNFLCTCRGTFITLNHLIPEVLKNSKPTTCSLIVKDCLVNVIYTSKSSEIMLLALPDKKCNLFELSLINLEVTKVLEFCYKSLNACFTSVSNVKKLDRLFSRLFSQILTCGYGWDSQRSIHMENIMPSSDLLSKPLFEQCLPIIQTVHLPWEARLQIDDALAELDATYISRSHQDVDNQDIFHIIGTCLYYCGHLLAAHLIQEDLIEIHSFLRMQGFLSISRDESLQNLVVWKEIFFNNTRFTKYEEDTSDTSFKLHLPEYRTFLVIIGKGNLLLAAVLRGMQNAKNVPPSPYFIEECESTIDLLIDVGLDVFLQRWFQSNLQPQVVLYPEEFLSSVKNREHGGHGLNKKTSPVSKKSTEIQSILKKRHASTDQINNPSNMSLIDGQLNNSNFSQSQPSINNSGQWSKAQQGNANTLSYGESEDSESQNSTSEISEERIQGRRAARDKENRASRNSFSSDSCTEWDGCEANSQFSGGYEFADLSQSLLQKMGILLPTKITAGDENVCFHFVRLESELGILLAPTVNVQKQSESELYKHILNNFRSASQKIHTLLRNTIRYKRMLSPSSSVNKSLVAIKEHGILFEVPSKLLGKFQSIKKNEETFNYWVIGRLFEHPKFTEVYVCCHESVPQNMIDIAFRLAFVT